MFSFIKKYASDIQGIDLYPNIALFLFLSVFVFMIYVTLRADKKYIDEIAHLPLD